MKVAWPVLRRWALAAVAVGAWAWVAESRLLPRAFVPSPVEVARGFVEVLGNGLLIRHVKDSVLRFAACYALGSGAGVVAGVLMGLVPPLGRFLRPLVDFFNAIAGIAWLPLAMMWFGTGEPTVAFVTLNGIFFVVAVNTLAGVQAVPRLYEYGLAVLGARRATILHQVTLPGAFPAIVTGLRLAMGFGWRALVASEMLAASSGMGYLVYRGSYDFRYDVMWASILLLGAISLALDHLVLAPLQRRTVERWGLVQG